MISSESKRKFEDWWQGRNRDPVLMVASWDGAPQPAEPEDDRAFWFDYPSRLAREMYRFEHTRYQVDGFPSLYLNFGPGVLGACMGGDYVYDRLTFWFREPVLHDLEAIEELRIREDNAWWQAVLEYTHYALDHAAGRFLVGITDIGGGMDVLAGLYGTQELLLALATEPQRVAQALEVVYEEWWKMYSHLSHLLFSRQGAMTCWNGIYAEQPTYTLQNDFSCMISAACFRDIDLPFLRRLCEKLALTVYHLDGPNATHHLDALLELEGLRAIQWIPGAGAPGGDHGVTPSGMEYWLSMLERIVAAGKGLELYVHPEEVGPLTRALGGVGLLFKTYCNTPRHADALGIAWQGSA